MERQPCQYGTVSCSVCKPAGAALPTDAPECPPQIAERRAEAERMRREDREWADYYDHVECIGGI